MPGLLQKGRVGSGWAGCKVRLGRVWPIGVVGLQPLGYPQAKNVKNILLKNLLDACLGALLWWALGHGLAVQLTTAKFDHLTILFQSPPHPAAPSHPIVRPSRPIQSWPIVSHPIAYRLALPIRTRCQPHTAVRWWQHVHWRRRHFQWDVARRALLFRPRLPHGRVRVRH